MSVFLAFRSAAFLILRRSLHLAHLRANESCSRLQLGLRGISYRDRAFPTNEKIPYQDVYIRDASGNLLPRPAALSNILQSIDTKTYVVRLLSKDPPTVRIYTKNEDIREGAKPGEQLKKAKKAHKDSSLKTVQLRWSTSDHDQDLKIAKVRQDLEKGDTRVNVVFMPKPGVTNPPRYIINRALDDLADKLADVGEEWRENKWERGTITMFFQSVIKKNPLPIPSKVVDTASDPNAPPLTAKERTILRQKKLKEARERKMLRLEEEIPFDEEQEQEQEQERELAVEENGTPKL